MHEVGGKLCKVRGAAATIMLSGIQPTATAPEILQLAVDKHYASDTRLRRTDYVLLYHDQQPVIHIPGGQEQFTLERYQKFVGKSFSKLILYICPVDEYDAGILVFFV